MATTRRRSASTSRSTRADAPTRSAGSRASTGQSTSTRRAGSGALTAAQFKKNFDAVVDNVESVIRGVPAVVRLSLVAMLCEGHILFEDLPGTGKSMLARALAASMSATNNRVQCTPDMLPGDITGSSFLDQRSGEFEFRPGPVFCNVLLADEVNRATPKTQSSLLEAMGERRVSADGVTYDLPRPFLVLATQNPVEQAGTFPLPEAQLDRFLFKLAMGYMNREAEFQVMFDNSVSMSIEALEEQPGVVNTEDVRAMIKYASTVEVADEVAFYIIDLVQATRKDPSAAAGGSPRASIALLKAARVMAASDGRSHVYPDDVLAVLKPVLGHRVIMNPDAVLRGETMDQLLERVTGAVKPPVSGRGRRGLRAGDDEE